MATSPISLKSSITPLSVSHSQYSPSRWSFFGMGSGGMTFGRGTRKLSSIVLIRRFWVTSSNKKTQNQSNGEEPPESLFMKELKKRDMTPASLLEESKESSYAGEETKYREEDGGFSQRSTVSTNAGRNLTNQLDQSRALNSEGLEGLIPRAKLLLAIGGTFFLGFWPLILTTVASFSALYLYFGPSFVHDARNSRVTPPEYIDPYQLLEEKRISESETAPRPY